MKYEAVIGLETHIELLTKTKLFCRCPNVFGAEPNTHCCEICLGHPGTLPQLSEEAVRLAARAGQALSCRINEGSVMARKNYMYPDLAKAYQITQGKVPLCEDGKFYLSNGRTVRIRRIHIEEDAGKLIRKDGKVLIDYNRAGVPLCEIVTEPDFRSGDEVREYLEELCAVMKTVGVSDCRMQEGSLRCDVNVSLRDTESGNVGVRTEIKNVNSYAFIVKAIAYEIRRQEALLSSGGTVLPQTLRYDSARGVTIPMRDKEERTDYRYFDEPDIPPLPRPELSALPALPREKEKAYLAEGVFPEAAHAIARYPAVSTYFEAFAEKTGDAPFAANVIMGSLFRFYGEAEREGVILPDGESAAKAYGIVKKYALTPQQSRRIFDTMYEKRRPFSSLFTEDEFAPLSEEALSDAADEAIRALPGAANDVLSGKEKALSALIGFVMKKTAGKADAGTAARLLKEKIKEFGKMRDFI